MINCHISLKISDTVNQWKKNILLLLMILLNIPMFSQSTQKIYFQSIRHGLSNQFVRCILKDSKGFMWFGTQSGLTRYDGVNYVVYENNPNDSNSISYNYISSIIEDKNKNLWIGTYQGLNLYNRDKNNFTRIYLNKDILVINSLCEDNDNNIWIGSLGNGLIQYSVLNKKTEYFLPGSEINSTHITSIVADNKNRLWIGSWNGLYLLNLKKKSFKHFENIPGDSTSLSNNSINALFLDNNNSLWIGTLNGELIKLVIDNDVFTFKNYLNLSDIGNNASKNIMTLCGDKFNNLWIGTENGGLIRFGTHSGNFDHFLHEEGNPYTLNSNTIRFLYIDDLNIVWVGTQGRGLNFYDKRYNRFESYKKNNNKYSLVGEDVYRFLEDNDGNVWIATNDGICRFNYKTRQFTKTINKDKGGLSVNAATSLALDSYGNLWIGTWGGGIDRFNKNLIKTGNFKIQGINKAGENKVMSLFIDKKNNVWAGSAGTGLFKFDKEKESFHQVFDTSQAVNPKTIGFVTSIIEDSFNNLWIGTAYKLFCLKDTGNNKYSFTIYENNISPGSITSSYITILFEDKNRNLWVGSSDQGLFLYNRLENSFISFSKKDGLPSNSISGILEDNKGNLWISTKKGISKYDKLTKQFRNFTIEDGLVSNEFYNTSCLKVKSGEFLFGSSDGFNLFSPDSIKDNMICKPVYLTDFKLFNKSVEIGKNGSFLSKNIGETSKIVLNHKQSSFTIEFIALNYIQGSKSQYAYMLEGLEDEWNNIENKNYASYNYVKPGKYNFKVKGSNNDGLWNETPETLEITILPPFWKTMWAKTIYLMMFILIIYAFIRYRIARLRQIHLSELNQMKLQFFANISHELRTPLSLIISPLENLLTYAKKNKDIRYQIELIYRNSNRLFRLVNEIMDFSKAEESKLNISVQSGDIVKFTHELSVFFKDEALRRQINYQFEAQTASIEAWFDRDKYEKIILNLLSNAFKFTPDNGTILIKVEKQIFDIKQLSEYKLKISKDSLNEFVKISVTDNGKGISPADISKVFDRFYQGSNNDFTYQTGTGIGLSLTRTLVELHHGKIFVTSEKGKETCFTILMPLGNTHYKKNEIIHEPLDIKETHNHLSFARQEDNISYAPPKDASTILLVEDNYELRKYIQFAFSAKYKVLEANDGEIGYKMAVDNIPDLIISDIIMPNLSGIEFCKRIKENIVTSHIPVILLTAKITLEDQIIGLEKGADAYLTKPFNVRYLEVTTKNLIETRQKLYRRFSQEVYISPKEICNNPLDQHFIETIIKYIEENITSTELSVENLASHLIMSPTHTWRKIKSLTGQSTNEFIRTIRLKKAIKLMEESNLNVSEIGYRVGFSSPSYFTKCFREQYGKSPSAFLSKKENKE